MTTPNKAQQWECVFIQSAEDSRICYQCGRTRAEHESPPVWYSRAGSGGQGLIIDERTGRNVAVAYDAADAPLLAAAPELLEALRQMCDLAERLSNKQIQPERSPAYRVAQAAIAKAEGRSE